jgi:hypothetical protein
MPQSAEVLHHTTLPEMSGRVLVMENEHSNFETGTSFIHVHVCRHCGYALRREEVDSRQVASGMFHCPKYDLDGPLNVEIQKITELEASRDGSRGSGSCSQR